MDLIIELDNDGRIWVAAFNGTMREEAWVPGPDEHPTALRARGLCPLEEKYAPGRWASTTLDPQELVRQLWVSALQETPPQHP